MITETSTAEEFASRLTALALARDAAAKRKAVAEQMRAQFYALYVKPYDDEMAASDTALNQQEAQLRADMLAEVMTTGDVGALPKGVTFVRDHEWVYDELDVLAAARINGADDYIRTKLSLNKSQLNQDLEQNKAPSWVEAERVPTPRIQISKKLGDLVIRVEYENTGAK